MEADAWRAIQRVYHFRNRYFSHTDLAGKLRTVHCMVAYNENLTAGQSNDGFSERAELKRGAEIRA